MPRIFDNITDPLVTALQQSFAVSSRADFCVGFFNLRGWKYLEDGVDELAGGDGNSVRLLIGTQDKPQEELREALSLSSKSDSVTLEKANRLMDERIHEFRRQLTFGAPSNEDESTLKALLRQLKDGKVTVKLFLRKRLHAKLYLLYQFSPNNHQLPHPNNPVIGYVGSSNLTMSGLRFQMELNVDVADGDACVKLCKWFGERWEDKFCIDISERLVEVIEESWAGNLKTPYELYIKMAYHLSQEARAGISEFAIPIDFKDTLFEFQERAVRIAAGYLSRRGGVMLGDVVGLGKTLMATALARIVLDDLNYRVLIICPKNLVKMWEGYSREYRLNALVISMGMVTKVLPTLPAHRLVIIDESHNLRNREGHRFAAIRKYVQDYDAKVILLSATPYNKSFADLSNQLRLFLPDTYDLGIRPEQLLKQFPGGESEFTSKFQCPVRSLSAFEKSESVDDWRELMRMFLVRRTRSFIKKYAEVDPIDGKHYLRFPNGMRYHFPKRYPHSLTFDSGTQFSELYADQVIDNITDLRLPRYGLSQYRKQNPQNVPSQEERAILDNLSRAGQRLIGFCRTNLFKRLESSGQAFLQSIERHILRNYLFIYAINDGKPLPIGSQDASLLNASMYDEDIDAQSIFTGEDYGTDDGDIEIPDPISIIESEYSEERFRQQSTSIYQYYSSKPVRKRFKWIRSDLFTESLAIDLRADIDSLLSILQRVGQWQPENDNKLNELHELLATTHPKEKVLIFSQFADTVHYLETELDKRGIKSLDSATGQSANPTDAARRFSPVSNKCRNSIAPGNELRVLIATDVLSEGQNLQDCSIVVNYDLPWAIIRLIQRAGRVDRLGQNASEIFCYSFWPSEGVNRVIQLRERLRSRLKEQAEVVGTDEQFYEDDVDNQSVVSLYNEDSEILERDLEGEVDLASSAYQIWQDAIKLDPSLESRIQNMPDVVYSSRAHTSHEKGPEGVLLYLRTAEGNDALAWVDREGNSVTESQQTILRAAACNPDTPTSSRDSQHHDLVKHGVELIATSERTVGGGLGRRTGPRRRAFEQLSEFIKRQSGGLFDVPELKLAVEEIYKYPLQQVAIDALNRQFHNGIQSHELAEMVLTFRRDGRLCSIQKEGDLREPRIICSLGLFKST